MKWQQPEEHGQYPMESMNSCSLDDSKNGAIKMQREN